MNIAIIVRKLNIMGGTQREALSFARELKRLGHKVTLYTFLYSKEQCYSNLLEGFRVISLDFYPPPSSFLQFLRENQAAKKLAFLIDKDTDVLNPHDQVSYRVAAYFKKHVKNTPSVWMMNDMPTKIVSLCVIGKELNPDLSISRLKRFCYRFIDAYEIRKFIRPQDKIVVLDNRDRDWVRKYYGKDACVVRNGLDVARFPFCARNPLSSKKARLLLAGIFLPHRRFEDAIEAAKILMEKNYDIHVSIAGDYMSRPLYYKKIKDLIYGYGMENRVLFLGKIPEGQWKDMYKNNDIFIFPNHMQSWGIVVFEAMASGMPVIVSKTAGASEVLTDGTNALLVNPKAPRGIADGIRRLIDTPDLYGQLSKNGRIFVENNISWQRYTQGMLDAIELCRKGSYP